MKQIPVTRGMFALVDTSDYEFLMQWRWHCVPASASNQPLFYAIRFDPHSSPKTIRMHKVLCPQWPKIDHRDRNGLNNQRDNLRDGSGARNVFNQRRQLRNSSGFRGVVWNKNCGKWQAGIVRNKQYIYLGLFDDPGEAGRVYALKAVELYGEYCPIEIVELAN